MPPVPMTFRQAAKTDYIDGVLVPEGTLFYIPVRLRSRSAYVPINSLLTFKIIPRNYFSLLYQIRVINTWKEVWGENAEEYMTLFLLLITTTHISLQVLPCAMVGSTPSVQLTFLDALVPRWSSCMHRQDDVDHRNESCPWVRQHLVTPLGSFLLLIDMMYSLQSVDCQLRVRTCI